MCNQSTNTMLDTHLNRKNRGDHISHFNVIFTWNQTNQPKIKSFQLCPDPKTCIHLVSVSGRGRDITEKILFV